MKITKLGNVFSIVANIKFETLKKFHSEQALVLSDVENKPVLYVKAKENPCLNENTAFFSYANAEGNAAMNVEFNGTVEEFVIENQKILTLLRAAEDKIQANLDDEAKALEEAIASVTVG